MKTFEIRYNDGVYYGTITAPENICESAIQSEINNNNQTPNKDYHISRANFKEITIKN